MLTFYYYPSDFNIRYTEPIFTARETFEIKQDDNNNPADLSMDDNELPCRWNENANSLGSVSM